MTPWIDYMFKLLPVVVLLGAYFVRLESRIAKMGNDLCWIKKTLSRRSTDNRENGDADADHTR